MLLSLESIKDYQYCPQLFKNNYLLNERPSKSSTIDKFSTYCLFKTFEWFFNIIQDQKRIPTFTLVKQKFGELYSKDRTVAETVFMNSVQFNRGRVLEKRCVEALRHFYDMFSNNAGVPLLINKEYRLSVDGIEVVGFISVIRETKTKDIELMTFYPDHISGKAPTLEIDANRDICTIGASIAFKQMYGSFPDVHKAYAMFTGREFTCTVNAASHHNFNTIVSKIGENIENNMYYPVYNDHCINCAYRNKCVKGW